MKIDKEETNIGAHAILVGVDKTLILQERDSQKGLINSGMISMFGGTLKSGESPIDGLKRELKEELGFTPPVNVIKMLGTYRKTKEVDGVDWIIHVFVVYDVDVTNLKVFEGKGFISATPVDALQNKKLTRITKIALSDFINKNY